MLSALAAAFLCESSSRTSFPQLQQWLGFFWPWPTYAGPQFCSLFTGGNNTYLPHRHGVRMSFVIACKMLWDSLEEDAVWKEMHKEIHQLSLKIRDVEAPQGCKFGWNLTKVVKMESLLVLYGGWGGVVELLKIWSSSYYRERFKWELDQTLKYLRGLLLFFFWYCCCYYLLFLRYWDQMACTIHGASVLNTTMQCWPWSHLTLTVLVECLLLWSVYATK